MAFRTERHRLRGVLEPGEEILGSDFVTVSVFDPHGTAEPAIAMLPGGVKGGMILIVSDRDLYVVFRGGLISAPLDRIATVGRKRRPDSRITPAQVQVGFPDGSFWNLTYDIRSRTQVTGDIITECFFGRVIDDTIENGVTPPAERETYDASRQSVDVDPFTTFTVGDWVEVVEDAQRSIGGAHPFRGYQGDIEAISDSGLKVQVSLAMASVLYPDRRIGKGTRTVELLVSIVRHIPESGVPLGKAKARWDAGVLESSAQCTGVVTAYPDGLQARTDQDGNATIEWQDFEYFAFAEEDYKIILEAGMPWFWFFAIDCENSEERARWRQLLGDLGVSERK